MRELIVMRDRDLRELLVTERRRVEGAHSIAKRQRVEGAHNSGETES